MEGPFAIYLKRVDTCLKDLLDFLEMNDIYYVSPHSGKIGMGISNPSFNSQEELLLHFQETNVVYLDLFLSNGSNIMTLIKQDQYVIFLDFSIYDLNLNNLKQFEKTINDFSYLFYDKVLARVFDTCGVVKLPDLGDFYI